ncbi:MAG: integration host factor subunit beta [Blastopirellula sp.]|nr:MAG: integration host factor subunit beta [Blastopirellula sp.]
MTKKEIVKTISEEIGLTQLKTKEIVQKTFNAIVKTLVEEGRIELRNFGVFEVKKRAARKARNPRTGEKVFVPSKFVVTFKPGKEMEERVRQLEEAERLKEEQAIGSAESTQPATPVTPPEVQQSTPSTDTPAQQAASETPNTPPNVGPTPTDGPSGGGLG